MAIDALVPPPEDPSNRVAEDPAAAALGHLLFFETRLSSNRQVACVTCHDPERFFTDGKLVSTGVGVTNRNAPTVVGAAYSPWMFWDGRRDSLWAQALAPLESSAEMNLTRVEVVQHVARDPAAAALYLEAFGRPPIAPGGMPLPERAGPYGDPEARDAWARMTPSGREAIDQAFSDVGKAIAAYQRLLVPGPGRFDRYVKSLTRAPGDNGPASELSSSELMGLRLFMDAGRTQCLRCHNGPLFTNQGFHRVGTESTAEGMPEFGRFLGLQAALVDPFNCLGAFSDAEPDACRELRFMRRDHVDAEMGKFKTPTLRGLGKTAPYMHDGRHTTLAAVIDHYREPPPNGPNSANGHELLPLALSPEESEALTAFLGTLDSGIDAEPRWLRPPAQRSGNSQSDRPLN
jgi:cytochrome c peroxidase